MLVNIPKIDRQFPFRKLTTGIYQCDNHNFEYEFRDDNPAAYNLDYPQFGNFGDGTWFGPYGVCDSHEQLLEVLPREIIESQTPYVISVVQLRKEFCDPVGGWRWHKWGAYVGNQEPKCEYLYDEPVIEEVWTYHIYQVRPEEMYLEDADKLS